MGGGDPQQFDIKRLGSLSVRSIVAWEDDFLPKLAIDILIRAVNI